MIIEPKSQVSYITDGTRTQLTSGNSIRYNDNNGTDSWCTVTFDNNNVHFALSRNGQTRTTYPSSCLVIGIN